MIFSTRTIFCSALPHHCSTTNSLFLNAENHHSGAMIFIALGWWKSSTINTDYSKTNKSSLIVSILSNPDTCDSLNRSIKIPRPSYMDGLGILVYHMRNQTLSSLRLISFFRWTALGGHWWIPLLVARIKRIILAAAVFQYVHNQLICASPHDAPDNFVRCQLCGCIHYKLVHWIPPVCIIHR